MCQLSKRAVAALEVLLHVRRSGQPWFLGENFNEDPHEYTKTAVQAGEDFEMILMITKMIFFWKKNVFVGSSLWLSNSHKVKLNCHRIKQQRQIEENASIWLPDRLSLGQNKQRVPRPGLRCFWEPKTSSNKLRKKPKHIQNKNCEQSLHTKWTECLFGFPGSSRVCTAPIYLPVIDWPLPTSSIQSSILR